MTDNKLQFVTFRNPTLGDIVFSKVISEIAGFMKKEPGARYSLMIGSDSNGNNNGGVDIVSVIAIHRLGNGGRYFWHRSITREVHSLREKIYAEVDTSLSLAALFIPAFRRELKLLEESKELPFDFQIHVDVGNKGKTRSLVTEITGMVRGYGYQVFVKPESTAATTFADRHVR